MPVKFKSREDMNKPIQYCRKCLMSETKPDLFIDEDGVCNACRSFENRPSINWNTREKELLAILDKYRSKDKSNWDCVIPVSGGKDSHYQTIKMLEYGMNRVEQRIQELKREMRHGFQNMAFEVVTPEKGHQSGIITIKPAHHAKKLWERLTEYNVVLSLRNNCLRFSPHFYNTRDEVAKILDILSRIR